MTLTVQTPRIPGFELGGQITPVAHVADLHVACAPGITRGDLPKGYSIDEVDPGQVYPGRSFPGDRRLFTLSHQSGSGARTSLDGLAISGTTAEGRGAVLADLGREVPAAPVDYFIRALTTYLRETDPRFVGSVEVRESPPELRGGFVGRLNRLAGNERRQRQLSESASSTIKGRSVGRRAASRPVFST